VSDYRYVIVLYTVIFHAQTERYPRKLHDQLAAARGDSQEGKTRRPGARNGRRRNDVCFESGRAAHGEPNRRTSNPSNRLQHTDVHRIFHHVRVHHK